MWNATGSQPLTGLADWLRKAADAYAEKQLERDELASKAQASRDGLAVYLRIAAEHFRGFLERNEGKSNEG